VTLEELRFYRENSVERSAEDAANWFFRHLSTFDILKAKERKELP